jgi:hypothetical protein
VATLSDNFKVFLSRIEPSTERKKSAQDMPGKIRDYLRDHEDLETVTPHTRLGGSYGRQTATGDIKDVDVLVFVADEYEDDIPGLLKLLRDVLDDLPEYLDDCGEVTTRAQRRSVNVHLQKHDLFLDVVPVRLTTDKTTDVLVVPDREWEEWVNTQPLGYGAYLSELNGDHTGKIVPLVKMMKHWRDEHFERRRPKSYWLEALVVRHIKRKWVATAGKGYAEIVADLMDSIHTRFKPIYDRIGAVPRIQDPMLNNNVAWNWERSHFETFMTRLEESRKWARLAVEEEDDDEAVKLWKKVFGDDFPTVAEAQAQLKGEAFGAASAKGLNLITGSGLVTASPLAGIAAVTAPAKRFYGG